MVDGGGEEKGETTVLTITVTAETRVVDGVETRVVEEKETVGGEVAEISRNYFAIEKKTGDVYYFGEDSDTYEGGRVANHEGSWLAGVAGGRFGLALPGKPKAGAAYYQEIAPGVAMDRAEIVSVGETVKTPAGTFQNCVKIEETTPLEAGREYKYYAPGVGLVQDGALHLVKTSAGAGTGAGDPKNGKKGQGKAGAAGKSGKPPIQDPLARLALSDVGWDAEANAYWWSAINDPDLSAIERQDLIEDLNEDGLSDPRHPTSPEDLWLIAIRVAIIEEVAPYAMDEVNYDAFAEACKDLVNVLDGRPPAAASAGARRRAGGLGQAPAGRGECFVTFP